MRLNRIKGVNKVELTLKLDKTTKGAKRFSDDAGHNLYLRKEEVTTLKDPDTLKVSVVKA